MRALFEAVGYYPRTCVWEITARCNLRCIHCASSLGPRTGRRDELGTGRALRLVEELAELGCEYVALSGGEALLRKDWRLLAAHLGDRGVRVGMISNGLLVDRAAAKTMVSSGVSILAVSIDGLAPTHDSFRKRPGSFDAAVKALRCAAEAGLRIHAITHVNRLNIAEMGALHQKLKKIGVKTWLVQLSAPMGRMRKRRDLVLAPSELPAFAGWLAGIKGRGAMYVAVGDNIGYYTELEPMLRRKNADQALGFWCGCSAGLLTLGIEANGNVKGCLSLQSQQFVEGNLHERSLREIWEAPGAFAYTRAFDPTQLHDGCAACEYGEVCRGGCTFMAVATTGSPHSNPYCLYKLAPPS